MLLSRGEWFDSIHCYMDAGMTLVRAKNARLFLELGKSSSLSDAAKKVDVTFSHANALSLSWVAKGWVIVDKKGRTNKYVYTVKGEKICLLLIEVLNG